MIARIMPKIMWTMLILLAAHRASAHPLGNFSINQYSALRLSRDFIALRYIIDMAEIPTFQEIQETSITVKAEDPNTQAYLIKKVETLRNGLSLEINGRGLSLHVESKEIIFPPGAGGLPTLKIGVLYKAKLPADATGHYFINYRDGNFAGRAGWKEVIANADSSVTIEASSAPHIDRSAELSDYRADLLNSPPQQLSAQVTFAMSNRNQLNANVQIRAVRPDENAISGLRGAPKTKRATHNNATVKKESGGSDGLLRRESRPLEALWSSHTNQAPANELVPVVANKQSTPRDSFTELIAAPDLGWSIVVIALAVAVGLGALHALEPGHGKTLVAAYLVGSRGTMKHALLLGLIVTAAHTAGVYLLGGVTIYASQYVVPERLYPWLGVASGLMITILGAVLFIKRYRDKGQAHSHHQRGHTHAYDHAPELRHDRDYSDVHDHVHSHGQHAYHSHHEHEHDHGSHAHYPSPVDQDEEPHHTSARELLTLGISGGIIPCPAALVVLLGAVALGRVGFGLLLIVAFSLGLAAVLVAIGVLMVSARRLISKFQVESPLFRRWLPQTSALIIALFGIVLAAQALKTTAIL